MSFLFSTACKFFLVWSKCISFFSKYYPNSVITRLKKNLKRRNNITFQGLRQSESWVVLSEKHQHCDSGKDHIKRTGDDLSCSSWAFSRSSLHKTRDKKGRSQGRVQKTFQLFPYPAALITPVSMSLRPSKLDVEWTCLQSGQIKHTTSTVLKWH